MDFHYEVQNFSLLKLDAGVAYYSKIDYVLIVKNNIRGRISLFICMYFFLIIPVRNVYTYIIILDQISINLENLCAVKRLAH